MNVSANFRLPRCHLVVQCS